MSADRRRHPRREVLAHVRVEHARVCHVLEVRNVSLSGALLDLDPDGRPAWVSLGQIVELGLFEPGRTDALAVTLRARVVRIIEGLDGHQVGVEFVIRDPAVLSLVDGFVERAPPRPPPLPRAHRATSPNVVLLPPGRAGRAGRATRAVPPPLPRSSER